MLRTVIRKAILAALICGAFLAIKVWNDTMRDPEIVQFVIESNRMPAGAKPFTIAFITDIHVAGPDMPPSRVEDIVKQVNALDADLIAIGGDLVSEKRVATKVYEAGEIVTPLGQLQARHGVVFVPGNHDHWYDWPNLSAELAKHSQITVLQNEAKQFGPIALGGVDDDFVGYADLYATTGAMQPLNGPRIMLTHTPDIFPSLPVNIELTLAGHTHCGQIAYPWGGAPATMSDYGNEYACGVVEENGKTLITSAGLGTSLLPIRLFTHPEIWLIEVRPAGR